MVVGEAKRRSSIGVSRKTKDALDAVKHVGQRYDGLIQELVWLREKEPGVEHPSPKERGQGRS